jgi:hypothetical protein
MFISTGGKMSKRTKAFVLDAFDRLALALANKHHQWTQAERRAYETAVRLLS